MSRLRAAVSTDLDAHGPAYRPAIDGYRGLFIILVMAYHFGATFLVGGWIGINHFFVFSGFLIGKILIKEYQRDGRIDVLRFYRRRARRIIPAMMLLVTAVLIHTALVAGPNRPRTAGDAFATLTFWLNWRLIGRNDQYFDIFDPPSPLRHVWTLAVEEQFYLLVPWLVIAIYALVWRKSVRVWILLTLAAASALWTAYLAGLATTTSSRLYYGTDVRMQALLIGVAAGALFTARAGERPVRLSRGLTNTIGIIGTVVSLSAFFVLDENSYGVFKYGGVFVFALFAASMGISALDTRDLLINRIFSWSPLVQLGQISYGLYLFHWPIGLWLPMNGMPRAVSGLLQFALTWVLAVASYRLVELPIMTRGMRVFARRRSIRRWLGPGLVATLAAAALVVQSAVPGAAASAWNGTPLGGAAEYVPPSSPLRVAIVGDSIPSSLADGFVPASYPNLKLLRFAEYGGCEPSSVTLVVGGKVIPEDGHCPAWRSTWPGQAKSQGAQVILAPAGLSFLLPMVIDGKQAAPRSPQVRTALVGSLDALLRQYRQTGARQLQLMNVPCRVLQPGTLPVLAQQSLGSAPIPIDSTWANGIIADWAAAHRADGVSLLDLNGQLCDGGYKPVINGASLYQDGIHFTVPGAQLVWSWLAPTSVSDWQRRSSG